MKRWIWTCAAIFLCVLAMGCGNKANDQDAIRTSIDKHLNEAEGLNLSAMDREIKQVTVNGDHASAQVEFRLKQGDARMEIEYTLDRQGKDWAVVKSAPVAGSTHTEGMGGPNGNDAGGAMPPAGHGPTN